MQPTDHAGHILARVCTSWSVSLAGLRGSVRTPRLSEARAAAALLLNEAGLDNTWAGGVMWKHPSTVKAARERGAALLASDPDFAARVAGIRATLRPTEVPHA